ncbi:TPA: hypothetical protein ACH3X3_000836 [Trebouxia sp. C0006]
MPLLLTRFAALSPNLLVPLDGQQLRSGEWAAVTAAEELRPIMLVMIVVHTSRFSHCTTPEGSQLDAETRTKEVKDLAGKQGGYRLACLRAAILAARIACCVDFSNNADSPEAMVWQCLLLVSARFDNFAPDEYFVDVETQQEEQTLCVLLTQLLFSALQESANKRKHKQYRGRAACSMLISMFYCGAADCATIAGLLLKSVVEAEELGPCLDNACQHEPDELKADQIESCLSTMMVAAEVMIGTLPDASQSSTGPTTVRASQQRRGAKSRQSSALLPAVEERAGVAALAALEYTLYQNDVLGSDVTIDTLTELIHDLLLPVIPDATVNLVQVYQDGLPVLLHNLEGCLADPKHMQALLEALMDRLAQRQDLLKADVVKMGPSLWLALDNLLEALMMNTGCLQDNSLSLHVVHSLLAHKQIGAWNLSDIDRTSQIHFHLVEVLGELCQYGLREARWLSAACVTKTWHCEFVSHPKEEEEEDESECNSIDGFGKVHESLLEIFQNPGPWSDAKCLAAVLLLVATTSDPVEMHEATQASVGLQKMMPLLEAGDTPFAAEVQSGFAEVGGMQILTELYTEYPFSGHGQAIHPQLHHTAGADPGSYEAIKAALLDCIWTAGLSHGQTDVNAMYFAQHGLSAAAGSVTALAATAWSGFAQEKHRADMRHFIWSKPCLEPAKRAELEKVVRVVFACHRAAWGPAGFSGGSPPEGIAKLVYVLLYDSVAGVCPAV